MKRQKLPYIILHDGKHYFLFERMGKNVPFEAYNPKKSLKISENLEEVLGKSGEVLKISSKKPQNLGEVSSKSYGSSEVPRYLIEDKPYEVIFND